MSTCNLLIYLTSRVDDGCESWLRSQLEREQVLFLRHALLWAMCHVGSDWALGEFFSGLESDPQLRSECRGYTLYYYGDLPRDVGPPYCDDTPAALGCSLTYRRMMMMFEGRDFRTTVSPQRRFIDLYTFLDILTVREITVTGPDTPIIRKVARDLQCAALPASLLTRIAQVVSRAGISG